MAFPRSPRDRLDGDYFDFWDFPERAYRRDVGFSPELSLFYPYNHPAAWADWQRRNQWIAQRQRGSTYDYAMPMPSASSSTPPPQTASHGGGLAHSETSVVRNENGHFNVSLDVKHFKPEEITVKCDGNSISIHGKHEERSDELGIISREFNRRYELPGEVQVEKITCTWQPNNVLKVSCPKKLRIELDKGKVIPINVSPSLGATAAKEAAGAFGTAKTASPEPSSTVNQEKKSV